MTNIGDTIYYRTDSNFVQKAVLVGETSRSWLVGRENSWWLRSTPDLIAKCADKLPKKGTTLETLETYELSLWASRHRREIRQTLESVSDTTLKKIAELIGYEPKP